MSVKLILLKSGEDVIANIKEMIFEDKTIGYFLENPCSVKVFASDNDDKTKIPCKIQLTSWIPLTSDKEVPIPSDWVVTMVEPIFQLKDMYLKNLTTNKNGIKDYKNNSIDEQFNSDQSN